MQQLQINQLPVEIQDKIQKMKEIAKKADSKYYNYNVCAMLVDEDSNEFIGVNWEPANGSTVCGEVGAISTYVLSDRKAIKYVLTYGYPKAGIGRDETFCLPCGSCRQRLLEYVNENTICYGVNETGTQVKTCEFNELLPHAFSSSNLNE